MKTKVALAADHRGFEMKAKVISFLQQKGFEPVDCGTFSDAQADYPDFMLAAAEKVSKGECQWAIGICHSGIGSSIVANKVKGVRAALCQSVQEAELSRMHNNANMLILGSGFIKPEIVLPLIDKWLTTPFEGGRHERRVNKITDYEKRNC